MLSDQYVDYEISLFDVIEFKRIKTNDKRTLETNIPLGGKMKILMLVISSISLIQTSSSMVNKSC
jgi:hypothetical protein